MLGNLMHLILLITTFVAMRINGRVFILMLGLLLLYHILYYHVLKQDKVNLSWLNKTLFLLLASAIVMSQYNHFVYVVGPFVNDEDVTAFIEVIEDHAINTDIFVTEKYIELKNVLKRKLVVTEKMLQTYLNDLAVLESDVFMNHSFIDYLEAGKTFSALKKETAYFGYDIFGDCEIMVLVIQSFFNDTSDIVLECLNTLDFKGPLVIDLRNNSGGELQEVISVMEWFLAESTELLSLHEGMDTKTYVAKDNIHFDGPVFILLNENTASAAEMLALSLKLNLEEVNLLGSNTYGKYYGQSRYTFKNSGFNLYLVDFTWDIKGKTTEDLNDMLETL